VVIVTSDKVYENHGAGRPFDEERSAGRPRSLQQQQGLRRAGDGELSRQLLRDGPPIATVRAGNVIGGGDWSADRLIPDCVRALEVRTPVSCAIPMRCGPGSTCSNPCPAI
jgi:CDP-glucose 4,6-dehydratase